MSGLASGHCVDCDGDSIVTAVEYPFNHPEHYDGISEYRCMRCGRREGRWTGARLTDGSSEPRYGVERESAIAEEQARFPEGTQPR